MNSVEFQGLCPLCYKPISAKEESRKIENSDRQEMYHASCLHEYVKQNTAEGITTSSQAMSILEQHKSIFIGNNDEDRREWISSQEEEWQSLGEQFKNLRETFGFTVSQVSRRLCVSPSRLKRFENGEPVRDAKLLRSGYLLLFQYINTDIEFTKYMAFVDFFYGTNKQPLQQHQNQGSDGE